ncbi:hypothetical protein BsWGS_05177 [Bradybaena similaris]
MAASSRQRKSRTNRAKEDKVEESAKEKRIGTVYVIVLIILAGGISLGHRWHLSSMFENDRHFSHLSSLERELGFRTEMGLYYSYFKTMITSESAYSGLQTLIWDNITEYPSTINTLKRFNLYPEVFLGYAYRLYQGVSDLVGHRTKTCWTVNRGQGLSPVQSCEGLGEPAYFYIEAVFLLNGLMMGLFFLFGTYLSGSLFGGLITVTCFLFNHGECTRVMWTPPLRESFGYPFFVLQMFILTYIIRSRQKSCIYSGLLACAQIFFMLSWQFAQFALFTQTLAVLGTYLLKFISSSTFRAILLGQTVGLIGSYLLLFGNEMLLTSFFACSLIATWIVVLLESYFRTIKSSFCKILIQGFVFVTLTLISKFAVGKLLHLEDDAHIGEILMSKFTDFRNFHTMLYTCAKEFDFIEDETLWSLLKTLLIPSAAFTLVAVTYHILVAELQGTSIINNKSVKISENKISDNKITDSKLIDNRNSAVWKTETCKHDAELVYHTFQMLAFTGMAVMVMRLKLFWTPHLCLYSSLLASPKIFGELRARPNIHMAALIVLLAVMMWQGKANIDKQRGIIGEFSNVQQEELIEWINNHTPPDAVFAGAMPTMATVKLCTLRPIVNHPHYEDAGLRARTKLVYSMYSRKPLAQVRDNLKSLGVQYAVLEDSWCIKRSKPGCSMPEIWDLEDGENQGRPPACTELKKIPQPYFKPVFKNSVYTVLKLV